MLAVLKMSRALLLQPKISLVHQCGALQSVVRAFLPEITVRHPPQFVIHEGKGGTQAFIVTGMPVGQ